MTPGKSLLHPLTALRFFAAILIVLHHAYHVFGAQFAPTSLTLDQGVSFFFVLSGFILAYNYPTLNSRESVWMFYAARFARVWPVHIATILVTLAVSKWPPASHIVLNVLLLQSWVPYKDFFFTLNAVSWSLSVELFFYLSFPLLIWRWKEYWHWKVLIALLMALSMIFIGNYFQLPSWQNTTTDIGLDAVAYINPLARLFEFVLGICTASIYRYISQINLEWNRVQATMAEIGIVLLAVLTLRFCNVINATQWIGRAGALYVSHQGGLFVWAALILIFAFERGWISKMLSLPVAVRLGEISFSLYMIHTMVLSRFESYTKPLQTYPALSFFCYLAVCLAISYATFIGIEQPVRLLILSIAKRTVNADRKISFPAMSATVKPMIFGVAIVVGILIIEGLAKPYLRQNDLVEIRGNDALEQSTSAHAIFNSNLVMEEFNVCLIDHATAELTYVLRPQTRLNLENVKMAVHLMGPSSIMMGSLDHIIDNNASILEAGSYWRRDLRFPSAKLDGIDQIGFAMFVDVKNLYAIGGAANTDWDGKRLTFPLPTNWKRMCVSQ
jgi:peptidoglycan/LPS O-acetylase OafA/YrhL